MTVAFSHDNKLVAARHDTKIRIFSLVGRGHALAMASIKSFEKEIENNLNIISLQFSPNDEYLLVGCLEDKVKIYNLKTNEMIHESKAQTYQ